MSGPDLYVSGYDVDRSGRANELVNNQLLKDSYSFTFSELQQTWANDPSRFVYATDYTTSTEWSTFRNKYNINSDLRPLDYQFGGLAEIGGKLKFTSCAWDKDGHPLVFSCPTDMKPGQPPFGKKLEDRITGQSICEKNGGSWLADNNSCTYPPSSGSGGGNDSGGSGLGTPLLLGLAAGGVVIAMSLMSK